MGENSEGPSEAARSAQAKDPLPKRRSLIDWFMGRTEPPVDPIDNYGSAKALADASADAQDMMINVRKMRDVRIEVVAVPRADIVAIPDSVSLEELVDVFRESTYSRLPVYSETLDNPVGFVHLKDVALKNGFGNSKAKFSLRDLIRPLLYAPPSMPLGVLLQKMQSERIHMALVIDEYGGADGLVTIEDLVEQIVGEIADEHDIEEGDLWVQENPSTYLCYSRAPLQDFENAAGVDLLSDELDEDVDTIGGLVFMLAGRVPQRGEVVLHKQGHEFEVVDADPRSVKRVRVRINTGAVLDKAAE